MVYKFEYKTTHYKIPAQQAGEYLQDLSDKENGITAKRVLDVSRPEDALLHDVFEWDDSIAAEEYRLYQSRNFIGNIVAVEITAKEEQKPVRAFVNVVQSSFGEAGKFKPVFKAMNDMNERKVILENALRELCLFKEKYKMLSELASVFAAIDDIT